MAHSAEWLRDESPTLGSLVAFHPCGHCHQLRNGRVKLMVVDVKILCGCRFGGWAMCARVRCVFGEKEGAGINLVRDKRLNLCGLEQRHIVCDGQLFLRRPRSDLLSHRIGGNVTQQAEWYNDSGLCGVGVSPRPSPAPAALLCAPCCRHR